LPARAQRTGPTQTSRRELVRDLRGQHPFSVAGALPDTSLTLPLPAAAH
jgi:hypothetical protein